jgi:hypothetical protein
MQISPAPAGYEHTLPGLSLGRVSATIQRVYNLYRNTTFVAARLILPAAKQPASLQYSIAPILHHSITPSPLRTALAQTAGCSRISRALRSLFLAICDSPPQHCRRLTLRLSRKGRDFAISLSRIARAIKTMRESRQTGQKASWHNRC